MRNSLKQTLKQVKTSLLENLKNREKWILEWPGQLCITASQVIVPKLLTYFIQTLN